MFNKNRMKELEFYTNSIPFSMTTLEFGNYEIIVPNVSSLVIKLMTYSNGYGLVFGAYIEDRNFMSEIAKLSISSDEFKTIKTNYTKLDNKDVRQIIKNKFNLDMMMWTIGNSYEIQFVLKNPNQDNHFDCIQIIQDVFNQITS